MSEKRRYILLAISVTVGTLLSLFIFKMKRGGALTSQDWLTLGSIFLISLVLLISLSIIFNKADKDKLQ
jgi:hypothetical protein